MTINHTENGKNNSMGSELAGDDAVERVTDDLSWRDAGEDRDFDNDDIRTVLDELESKEALIDRLKAEAQSHAMEARIANGTIAEIYHVISEGKGSPGNWNGAVYVEGIPLRSILDTDYGDKVPPIPHVEPKKVADLLSERGRLRKILIDMITAIQDGQIDSPELGGGDVPVHRWHEEWLHHAEQALKGGAA